ncbi:flavin reductase like domain-containing protein [Trichoderma compactum]
MRPARAVRQLPRLGCCGASRVTAGCLGDARMVMVQKRGFWALRLVRGVHDVVGHALTPGENATGVRSPRAGASSSIAPQDATSIAEKPQQSTLSSQSSHTPSSWHTSFPIPPTTDPTSPAALSEQIRSIMRLLPHSVVVCTSTHGQTPRAMTMSSFTSLTLSPTPLISFNIATPSRTLDAMIESRHFNIHIMSGDELGVQVADRFTRGNTDDVFDGLEYDTSNTDGAPLLRGEGIMYALRCRLLPDEPTRGLLKVRDHVIVVGEVVEMIPGSCANKFGLSYADRKYRQIGSVISQD